MPPYKSLIVISYTISANFTQGIDIACAASLNGVALALICKLDRLVREITFQLFSVSGTLTRETTIGSASLIELTVKEF